MGLFCLPKGNTKEDYIRAAIQNLELFLEESKSSQKYQYRNGYMLEFARQFIDDAEAVYKKEIDANPPC